VGQAFLLEVEAHIYGSHRSHGEILAKGLSAIEKLDDEQLMEIMRGHFGGMALAVVEDGAAGQIDVKCKAANEPCKTDGGRKRRESTPPMKEETAGAKGTVKNLAMDYLLYGAFAEIFGREAGFNKGMGGSMHAFFPPFGIYPNNAVVGGSGDISVGAALYKHVNRVPGIVVCNIGDASSACGPVWEGMCLATMDQFKKLWEGDYRHGLPLMINFNNNFYGMGGQPWGETMGFEVLARLGAGINPEAMHAERVDGYNPLAVVDAMRRKKEIIEKGDGPVLLDTITYRFSGHSPSDASSYRTKEELEAWQQVDPIETFGAALVSAGVTTKDALAEMQGEVEERVLKAFGRAVDLERSPRADLKKVGGLLEQVMFSNGRVETMAPGRKAETLLSKEENPRVQALAKRSRGGFDEKGERIPNQRCVGIRDAIFEAVLDGFYRDATLVAYGEENRDWGGAFGVYRGLTEALPYHRLFNTPISEGAIVGSAVGYALEGGRVICELMYCDFLGRAGDEVFNQLSKWQSMSGGLLRMPVVLRISVGSKYGAQHSQDWTSMVAHVPGLKVVFPATPYDAKGLMNAALVGTDPVVFFESQRVYDMAELFVAGGVPEGFYEVKIGEAAVRKEGTDLTMVTVGATLYRGLEAAKRLEEEVGVSVEVIDARSLVPFDYERVVESVKKTRKAVLVSDACERGSFMGTAAAKITQLAFDELDGPPVVVGARNWITPADEVEDAFFPYAGDILDAVHEHILPLKGYAVQRACDREELMRREREGI